MQTPKRHRVQRKMGCANVDYAYGGILHFSGGGLVSMKNGKSKRSPDSSSNLGFEPKLLVTADQLRKNMNAAEYKHVVLGFIFFHADTFCGYLHPDLCADCFLTNPPFNDSDRFSQDDDVRGYSVARPRPTPTAPGCSTSSSTSSPTTWRVSTSPMAAFRPTTPAKATSAEPCSRPTTSTASGATPTSRKLTRYLLSLAPTDHEIPENQS